jgi:CheY-like chemotaxis protein
MTTENLNCLLIDDVTADLKIFCAALEGVDKTVTCVYASDGFDALKKLKDEHYNPDYIFIDMNMPRMNGNECLLEIKKIDRLKNVPVFMYSTSANPKNISQTKENGAAGYIVKPDNITELTETLAHLFKNRK